MFRIPKFRFFFLATLSLAMTVCSTNARPVFGQPFGPGSDETQSSESQTNESQINESKSSESQSSEAKKSRPSGDSQAERSRFDFAVVSVLPLSQSRVRGKIRLVAVEGGIRLAGKINNLVPGKHRITIHRFGDIRSRDGSSLGKTIDHGEMGLIEAAQNGVAVFEITADDVAIDQVIGRGLVIGGNARDLMNDPSGKTGDPVGHGVIGVGNRQWSYLNR